MVDTDGDGHQDIVAGNSAGDMFSYRSDGAGRFVDEVRRRLATGWQNARSISVSSGFIGASSTGLVVKNNSGTLNYVPVPGNSSLGQAKQIGVEWGTFRVAGGEEISWPTPTPQPKPTPSLKSVTDVVVVDKGGSLWRHANNGAKLGPAEKIGVGFGTAKSLHILDWNADGTLDMLVQTTTGSLNFIAGRPGGAFDASRVLASTGWADADVSSGQWIKGAKYPSIIAQRPDGSLTSYTTNNGLSLGAGLGIGYGFLDMHPIVADYDGDGNADVSVIDRQGKLIMYRSNGKGSFLSENRQVIGVGWQGMTSVSPANKLTSPNSSGLLARTAAGGVYYYPVSASLFSAPVQLAIGWGGYLIGGSSTLSQQSTIPLSASDVVSSDSGGTLWRSRATRTGNFAAGEKLGQGWTQRESTPRRGLER
ncbi:FG-GAP repeat domain-containing protein [Arthrobacter psychrolactophilus]